MRTKPLNDGHVEMLIQALGGAAAAVFALACDDFHEAAAARKCLPKLAIQDTTDPAEWRDFAVQTLEHLLDLLKKEPASGPTTNR